MPNKHTTEDWEKAIAKAEGYYAQGSIPGAAHNPGDLKLGDKGFGTMGNGITVFPDEKTGFKALGRQVQAIQTGKSANYNPDMTLAQVAEKYTGKDKAADWANTVGQGIGMDPSTKISDADKTALHPAARHEAGHVVVGEALRPGSIGGSALSGPGGGMTINNPPAQRQTIQSMTPNDVTNNLATSLAGGLTQTGGTTRQASSGDLAERTNIIGSKSGGLMNNLSRLATGKTPGMDYMIAAPQLQAAAQARVMPIISSPEGAAKIDKTAEALNAKRSLNPDQIKDLTK